jgi:2-oxo-4-hydroxy-4-carboxy-5-ureidoimidazoline decarboxylase
MINLPEAVLRGRLSTCLDVPRWIDSIVERAPFGSLDDLIDAARVAADPLTREEIERALDHHARIGTRPSGAGGVGDDVARPGAELVRDLPQVPGDDPDELKILGEELREIALLRIEQSFTEDG